MLLRQPVEEIALVLARIHPAQQFDPPGALPHAGVVAGGDAPGAQPPGVVQECLELDLGVAQHVRVGRPSGGVFAQELGKHAFLVFRGKVDRLEFDAEHVRDGSRVDPVLAGGTVFAAAVLAIVILPVLHEQAGDGIALLLEQVCGDGGVDPPGEADDDGFQARVSAHKMLNSTVLHRLPGTRRFPFPRGSEGKRRGAGATFMAKNG